MDVGVLPAAEDLGLVDVVLAGRDEHSLRHVPVGAVEDELCAGGQVTAPRRARRVARVLPVGSVWRSVAAVDGVLDALAATERVRGVWQPRACSEGALGGQVVR